MTPLTQEEYQEIKGGLLRLAELMRRHVKITREAAENLASMSGAYRAFSEALEEMASSSEPTTSSTPSEESQEISRAEHP